MDTTFERGLGAIPSEISDYRNVTFAMVQENVAYLNGVTHFLNDYSMIPVIDQGGEPECVECAAKYLYTKKVLKKIGMPGINDPSLIPDVSTRAWYQIARMYGAQDPKVIGSQPYYADLVSCKVGLIGTKLVPEQRSLLADLYGSPLDITIPMIDDAITKKIPGFATPNLTLPEITNAIQTQDGLLVTIAVDDSWFRYKPGIQELDGKGIYLGYHRVLLTGFSVKPNGEFWIHGKNTWGPKWGIGGDFEFNLSVYMAKMSDPRIYCDIPDTIIQKVHNLPQKPSHTFTQPFRSGTRSADVTALQDILKYEGLFPLGTTSNGIYGAITTAGALAFMERYAVADIDTLDTQNRGAYVGALTIAKLNELYAPKFPGKIIAWASAIKSHEGYFAPGTNSSCPNGSLSWLNKNPGNFKWAGQANAIQSGPWACFDTYQHGFDYLCGFLNACATAGVGPYSPTMTLLSFTCAYCPDGTGPQYASQVANNIGVTVDTPIKNLVV